LPNVPRIITSWFPRREPKVFQSTCSTPCSRRYRAAGPFLGMDPAGEMWSVVTESPSTASARAPSKPAQKPTKSPNENGKNARSPRRTPAPPSAATNRGPHYATTAHGPDLFASAQQAVRYMIDHLVQTRGLSREQAYVVCSVAADLKISEIVDAPNWIVSAFLPDAIFVER